MDRAERIARLRQMVKQIEPEADLTALATESPSARAAGNAGGGILEGMPGAEILPGAGVLPQAARTGLDKVLTETGGDLSDGEALALEAIVLREGRPVAFIRNGQYDTLGSPWAHLNEPAVRNRLQPLFPSIGRVDLPNSTIPYGGTAFVVGPDLLMTNRHVAALFTVGLGNRGLRYQAGTAGVNFKREVSSAPDDRSAAIDVREVVLIHPFWDMALLRVSGLPAAHRPLRLSIARPEELVGRDVIVVGYPALDPRNDVDLQNQIFERRYEVKRIHPGKLRRRETIRSFESQVNAATHDSSTLGGNSGSAVVDVQTGEVVALHFAGIYLRANYAVPTFELARDPRVVAAGVGFTGTVPGTAEWDSVWAGLEESPARQMVPQPHAQAVQGVVQGATTWTIPITVTVSVGTPASSAPTVVAPVTEATMRVPVIAPDLETRTGYDPGFLGINVPVPKLSAAGTRIAAKLEDGSTELKYHRFSVIVNKKRRLAILTAANVDWRPAVRRVNGRKPTREELTGLPDGVLEEWVTDPRIPDGHQLPDVFFTKDGGKFDKGHVVRRDDIAWGTSFAEMQMGNGDTYHTPNCSPQVAGFNRSPNGEDNWGDLENMVQRETRAEKVCVFAGPVLAEADRRFSGRDQRGPVQIQIPQAYWKIVVANTDAGPQSYGFVLEQDLSAVPVEAPLEFAVPQPWRRFLKPVADIEDMLNGWAKLTWLKEHDGFETDEGVRLAAGANRVGG